MTWVGRLRRRFWVGFLLEIVIAVATAVPVFVAAHVLGQLVSATRGQVQMDNGLAWRSLAVIAACVVVRAVLKFLKDTVQESIGYERAAQTRLAVGDVLKRVPLGYFQLVGTGNILSHIAVFAASYDESAAFENLAAFEKSTAFFHRFEADGKRSVSVLLTQFYLHSCDKAFTAHTRQFFSV